MGRNTICCAEPALETRGASPFRRIIVLDDYDGPLGGVLACGRCGAEYVFTAVAWRHDGDVRVYELAG